MRKMVAILIAGSLTTQSTYGIGNRDRYRYRDRDGVAAFEPGVPYPYPDIPFPDVVWGSQALAPAPISEPLMLRKTPLEGELVESALSMGHSRAPSAIIPIYQKTMDVPMDFKKATERAYGVLHELSAFMPETEGLDVKTLLTREIQSILVRYHKGEKDYKGRMVVTLSQGPGNGLLLEVDSNSAGYPEPSSAEAFWNESANEGFPAFVAKRHAVVIVESRSLGEGLGWRTACFPNKSNPSKIPPIKVKPAMPPGTRWFIHLEGQVRSSSEGGQTSIKKGLWIIAWLVLLHFSPLSGTAFISMAWLSSGERHARALKQLLEDLRAHPDGPFTIKGNDGLRERIGSRRETLRNLIRDLDAKIARVLKHVGRASPEDMVRRVASVLALPPAFIEHRIREDVRLNKSFGKRTGALTNAKVKKDKEQLDLNLLARTLTQSGIHLSERSLEAMSGVSRFRIRGIVAKIHEAIAGVKHHSWEITELSKKLAIPEVLLQYVLERMNRNVTRTTRPMTGESA